MVLGPRAACLLVIRDVKIKMYSWTVFMVFQIQFRWMVAGPMCTNVFTILLCRRHTRQIDDRKCNFIHRRYLCSGEKTLVLWRVEESLVFTTPGFRWIVSPTVWMTPLTSSILFSTWIYWIPNFSQNLQYWRYPDLERKKVNWGTIKLFPEV